MTRQHTGKPSTGRRDHYQEVTDRIVAELERGVRPWRQPWDNGAPGSPVNAATGRRYHGINALVLSMTAFSLGGDPRFCSYKQAAGRGWQVRKGERSTTVFFFKRLLVTDRDAAPGAEDAAKAVPLLRSYSVFNGRQIDGIPAYAAPDMGKQPWRRPDAADVILGHSGAAVSYGGDRAFYCPANDSIKLPYPVSFHSPQAFASTAMHELAHWSGHRDRLDRDLTGRFGSDAYAMEELRAELTSVFIGSVLDLPCDIPNHANYLGDWARKLKGDKREIFRAAAAAQRIADTLLAFHPDYAANELADQDGQDADPPAPLAQAA